MPGAQCTRSLACKIKKHTSVVTTVTPEITRHSPRNGFTAYFALSPAIGLVVTVICASSRRLDASVEASEPHAFAVRFSAIRQRRRRVHRIPRSTSVTIASAPLRDETAIDILLIWVRREAEYFCKRGWTRDNQKTT